MSTVAADVISVRALLALFLSVLVLGANSPATAADGASSWKIRRLAGRDYLPVAQIAEFYRMQITSRGDRGIALGSDEHSIVFDKGSREARIDGVKHWLSFPALYFAGQFYVSRMDMAKTIDPVMRPQKLGGLKPVHTVILDPGHGAHDRGAVNRLAAEKNYNLDISRRIRTYLKEAGLRVGITRSRDEFIPLERRPAMANNLGEGTVFVSVHCNSSGGSDSLATGFEVYSIAPRGAPNSNDAYLTQRSFAGERGHVFDRASHVLATSIQSAQLGRVPMFDRGVKRARFAVLRYASVPAVLIECGFMSNRQDAHKLHTVEWRERLAQSVAMGIFEFCKLAANGGRPKTLAQYRVEEKEALASAEWEYQPLAGIGNLVRSPFPGLEGWRGLLSGPMSEEMPPFRFEYEPAGWVLLESWSASSSEDARMVESATGGPGAQEEVREWPDPVVGWPGLRGWRVLVPVRPANDIFVLFESPDSAPLAD